MGLSNEERYYGLCSCIKELVQIANQIRRDDHENRSSNALLLGYLDQLWFAFLGRSGNSLMWIMGSETANAEFLEPDKLFTAAIYNNHLRRQPDELDTPQWGVDEKGNKTEERELFDFVHEYTPTMESVLRDASNYDYEQGGAIPTWMYVKVYHLVEAAFYRLNRYHDEFSDRFKGLKDILCRIFGVCYTVFSEDEDFLAAFYMSQIADKLLNYNRDAVDWIWWKFNLQHGWRVPRYANDPRTRERLQELFAQVQGRLPSLEERLLISLEISRRHLLENDQKAILKKIAEHNKTKGAEQISVAHVQKAFKQFSGEKEKEEMGLHRYCWITGQSEDSIRDQEAAMQAAGKHVKKVRKLARKGQKTKKAKVAKKGFIKPKKRPFIKPKRTK